MIMIFQKLNKNNTTTISIATNKIPKEVRKMHYDAHKIITKLKEKDDSFHELVWCRYHHKWGQMLAALHIYRCNGDYELYYNTPYHADDLYTSYNWFEHFVKENYKAYKQIKGK